MNNATPIKCTRCRHAMEHGDLVPLPRRRGSPHAIVMTDLVCPKCGCKSHYDCTPQVAWCWASGLIQIGDAMPDDSEDGSGAIEIARGPKYALKPRLEVLARHAYRTGELLVPGVPEAEGQRAKSDALAAWLKRCGRRKSSDGVTFAGVPE